MRTEHLKFFVTLAETGSIMQTGKKLYTTHPVSYTHLDVYKRQPLHGSIDPLPENLIVRKLYASTLVALTSNQTATQQNLTKLSIQELLEKELIFFSHGQIEQSALYQGLAKYGTPNIVSVIGNPTIFTDTLENSNYFAIGTARTAQRCV